MTTNNKLVRDLRSVGMETFAKYFYVLSDFKIPSSVIVKHLVSDNICNLNSANSKVCSARHIIKHHNIQDALNLIIKSKNTKPITRGFAEQALINFNLSNVILNA